ncbi:E4 control protein 34 kDa [Human mastadenovirus B]|uniref:E4 control protein 34 kDa n=4 Tax=Human mastadenovirus B TaxID=108098 RepID=T1UGN0_9ADEN|nr:34 kDa protein [Human adenovirus B3]ACT37296.1 E4 ORF6 34.7 kDa protein [Human adenovirus 7]AGT75914.1 E4 control protein 34 kDa [Human mastadenovirus B]ACT37297.1 E4 ORF6 34.7 kDa protein [Human adenovirus 7]ACT37298.1 E4 ORF6 34.7 kDa protein [Human adenovirus 7]
MSGSNSIMTRLHARSTSCARHHPYTRAQLPRCEENETRASMTEDHPLLPDCDTMTMHSVSCVRGLPCSASFTVLQEFPIPWDMFLNPEELKIMKRCMHLCLCCATIDIFQSQVIHGRENWVLHCHCNQQGSLQCMAGGAVLAVWFRKVILGCMINQRCPWYRQIVNMHMPKEIMYVGSVFLRERHLIYIKLWYDGHAGAIISDMSFGWSAFNYGLLNNIVIMCCTYCSNLSEIRMRCCAHRTRKLMLRAIKIMLQDTADPDPINSSRTERRRQRLLVGLMRHNRPIPFSDYDSHRSSSR